MQRKGNNLKEIETHDSEHSSGPWDIRFYHSIISALSLLKALPPSTLNIPWCPYYLVLQTSGISWKVVATKESLVARS